MTKRRPSLAQVRADLTGKLYARRADIEDAIIARIRETLLDGCLRR
jgi:hypothetical protein